MNHIRILSLPALLLVLGACRGGGDASPETGHAHDDPEPRLAADEESTSYDAVDAPAPTPLEEGQPGVVSGTLGAEDTTGLGAQEGVEIDLSAQPAPTETLAAASIPSFSLTYSKSFDGIRHVRQNFIPPGVIVRNAADFYFEQRITDASSSTKLRLILRGYLGSWFGYARYEWGSKFVQSTPMDLTASFDARQWLGLESSGCRSDGTNCSWLMSIRNYDGLYPTPRISTFSVKSAAKFTTFKNMFVVNKASSCLDLLPTDFNHAQVSFRGTDLADNRKRYDPRVDGAMVPFAILPSNPCGASYRSDIYPTGAYQTPLWGFALR